MQDTQTKFWSGNLKRGRGTKVKLSLWNLTKHDTTKTYLLSTTP